MLFLLLLSLKIKHKIELLGRNNPKGAERRMC